MNKIELELGEYDRIVSALYDASLDSRRWGEALEMFRVLFQANFVTLILRSPDKSNLGMMIAVGLEGGDKVTYLPYGHSMTPFVNQPVDKVFTVEDLWRYLCRYRWYGARLGGRTNTAKQRSCRHSHSAWQVSRSWTAIC